ncbi:Tudor and KH domain-containing protein homolog [Geodia barretti]|nr:Tudor and KH domain-containing protein homolog [Geodia barretti]
MLFCADGEENFLAFECPGYVAGFVIGRDGKNRRDVESKTDTRIRVEKKEGDTAANTRVIIMGEKENRQKALFLIVQNLRRKTALHTATTETIDIPNEDCGQVIGRKGANVRAIENLTGTRINIKQPNALDFFLRFEVKCKITGSAEQIEKAKEMIRKCSTLLKLFCQIEEEDIEPPEGFSKIVAKFETPISEGTTLQDVERPGSFVVSFVVPNSVLERLKTDIPARYIFEMLDVTKLDVVECCVVSTQTDPGTPGESMKTSKVPGEISTTLYAAASVDGSQLARVIQELKDHIGRNWKAVARVLEFSTTDIDAIVCGDEHDLKEQIHRFFEQWKMREGHGASVQKLIEAVRAAELECGGIMPVQETARDAATRGTPTSERDLVRMKRLQKMSISDDPSFQPSSSPSGPRRSASSPSNSQTATELAKNSETSPIKQVSPAHLK